MKFDKELIVGFVICALILFGWGPLSRYMGWQGEVENAPAAEETQKVPAPAAPETKAVVTAPAAKKAEAVLPAVVKAAPFKLENEDVISVVSTILLHPCLING